MTGQHPSEPRSVAANAAYQDHAAEHYLPWEGTVLSPQEPATVQGRGLIGVAEADEWKDSSGSSVTLRLRHIVCRIETEAYREGQQQARVTWDEDQKAELRMAFQAGQRGAETQRDPSLPEWTPEQAFEAQMKRAELTDYQRGYVHGHEAQGTQRDRLRSALQRLVDSVVDVDFVEDDGEVNAVLSVHPDAVEMARAALSDPTPEPSPHFWNVIHETVRLRRRVHAVGAGSDYAGSSMTGATDPPLTPESEELFRQLRSLVAQLREEAYPHMVGKPIDLSDTRRALVIIEAAARAGAEAELLALRPVAELAIRLDREQSDPVLAVKPAAALRRIADMARRALSGQAASPAPVDLFDNLIPPVSDSRWTTTLGDVPVSVDSYLATTVDGLPFVPEEET